jgi:hypothetical protein
MSKSDSVFDKLMIIYCANISKQSTDIIIQIFKRLGNMSSKAEDGGAA